MSRLELGVGVGRSISRKVMVTPLLGATQDVLGAILMMDDWAAPQPAH